ncbi:MAG: metal-sensitive transcriptional regulator [Alphaproteobacteria bacterium]|nr:metal-sensitive transcriptional regulator [Alphaproteobacteria bacterium]
MSKEVSICTKNTQQQKISTRLNRIEGQIRGINKMVEENRSCMEILNQISSTQAALKGVWLEVVRNHLNSCIKNGISSGKNFEDLADELILHLEKIK